MNRLVDHPSLGSYDLSSLQLLSYGASPMPEALLQRAMQRLPGIAFLQSYGMTELSMQCYDSPIRRRRLGRPEAHVMEAPPWARTVILDPDTLGVLPQGQTGIICHYDLANCSSVVGILTEDLGVATAEGFRFLGRVKGSESRGCSVSVDEMLAAQGKGPA